MTPLQEKFQVIVPAKPEAGESWVTADSQRYLGGQMGWCPAAADDTDPRKFNLMPPGMELKNQWRTDQPNIPMTMGERDVSHDVNPEAWREGFTKRKMRGSDDAYTGEHVDHFYGDAGGFCERNNYLDRE